MARKYSANLTPIFDFNLTLKPSRYSAGLKKLQFAWSHPFCNSENQNALQGTNNAWNSAVALQSGMPFNWEKVSSMIGDSSQLAWDVFTTLNGYIAYALGRSVKIDEKVTFSFPEFHSPWIPLSISPNIATYEVLACYSKPNQKGTKYLETTDFVIWKSESVVMRVVSGSIPDGASVYFTYELDISPYLEKHITKEMHTLTDYAWEETTVGADPNVVFRMDSVTDSGNNPYTLDVDYNTESGSGSHYKVRRCTPSLIEKKYVLTGTNWTTLTGTIANLQVWQSAGETGIHYAKYVDGNPIWDFEYDIANRRIRRKLAGNTVTDEEVTMSNTYWSRFKIFTDPPFSYPTDVIVSCHSLPLGAGVEYFPDIDFGYNLSLSGVFRKGSGSIAEGQHVFFTYKYCKIKIPWYLTSADVYCRYDTESLIKNKMKVWFNYSYRIKSIGIFHDFTNRFYYYNTPTLESYKLLDGTLNWTINETNNDYLVNLGKTNIIVSRFLFHLGLMMFYLDTLKGINKDTGETAWEFHYTMNDKYLPMYQNAYYTNYYGEGFKWVTWGDPSYGWDGDAQIYDNDIRTGQVAIHNENIFLSVVPTSNVEGIAPGGFTARASEVLKISEETGEILARYNTCRTLMLFHPDVSNKGAYFPWAPSFDQFDVQGHVDWYPYVIEQDNYYSAALITPCCSNSLVVFIAYRCTDWVDKISHNGTFGLYAFNQSDARPAWVCELETHTWKLKFVYTGIDDWKWQYDGTVGEEYHTISFVSRITFLKNKFIIIYSRDKRRYGYSGSVFDGTFITAVSSSGAESWRYTLPVVSSASYSNITGAGDYISFYQKYYGTDLKWHLKLYILNVDTGALVHSENYSEPGTIYLGTTPPLWVGTNKTRRLLTKFGGFS